MCFCVTRFKINMPFGQPTIEWPKLVVPQHRFYLEPPLVVLFNDTFNCIRDSTLSSIFYRDAIRHSDMFEYGGEVRNFVYVHDINIKMDFLIGIHDLLWYITFHVDSGHLSLSFGRLSFQFSNIFAMNLVSNADVLSVELTVSNHVVIDGVC